MKFFKPTWVNHDGNPIFSVDIHPDGSRFATGGQGPEKCGRLIIWNMKPILSPKDEKRDEIPKKLCQLDHHLACINCVRWSNSGKYLASGGDDKNLMIWQIAARYNQPSAPQKTQSSVFESASVEQWRCIATLNGHNGDILDLGWSTNDQYLASCSVDNMIIIWDAKNFPQVITKITEHTGLVKGVSWDPTSKYLATQSDDKTLRVWRTSDWKEETKVKEPFKECGGTTHVLRLDWSPDGQTIVSAHAMNNSGSVAQLIDRDGWKTQRDLVGHRKAITCVRFNPNILYQTKTKQTKQQQADNKTNSVNSNSNGTSTSSPTPTSTPNANKKTQPNMTNSNHNNSSNNNNIYSSSNADTASINNNNNDSGTKTNPLGSKTTKYCCMAVGSRDRSISVWLTSQPRPLVVAHDLFESSVLDVSWSKDGCRLIACSQDGSVAVMIFSSTEIGHKLTADERQAHLQKLYGKSILSNQGTTKTLIVEDPDLIVSSKKLKTDKQAATDKKAQQNAESLLGEQLQNSHSNSISQDGFNGCESNTSMSGMSKGPTDRQIETLLPGGKRRITPLYIQPPLPFNSTSNITFSSSKESKTKILIETTTSSTPAPTPTPYTPTTTPVKNSTTSNSGQAASSQQANNNNNQLTSTTSNKSTNNHVNIITNVRREPTTRVATTTISEPAISATTLVPKSLNHRTLAPSKIDKATVFRIKDSRIGKEYIIEAENETTLDKLHELRLLDSVNNKTWEVLLSSRINSVIGTQNFVAASCIDNSIHLFELLTGRRLAPPLMLDSQVAHIAAEKEHLLVITSSAHMWLWDINQNKVLVKAEPVSPLLPSCNNTNQLEAKTTTTTKSNNKNAPSDKQSSSTNATGSSMNDVDNNNHQQQNANNQNHGTNNRSNTDINSDIDVITSCSLTEHNQPLILLSNGKAFIYDYINLQCWQLISDSSDFITRWSNCKPSFAVIKRFLSQKNEFNSSGSNNTPGPLIDDHGSLKRNLPLTSLQSQQHSHYSLVDLKRFARTANTEKIQVKATRSYLDHQLASALAIRSPHEYHYWLIQSVQHYVDTGAEARLKDLCSRLISGSFGSSPIATTSSTSITAGAQPLAGGDCEQQQQRQLTNNNSGRIMSSDSGQYGRSEQQNGIGIGSNLTDDNDIISSPFNNNNSATTSSSLAQTETRRDILGLNKRALLKEVLAILSKDLRYQRLYSEYKHLLDYDSTTSSVSDLIISLDPKAMVVDKQ